MFELWARDRNTNQYKYIRKFYDEYMIHTMVDTLDRNNFTEAMVLRNNRLLFYQEFTNPFVKRKENKHGYRNYK